MLVAAKAVRTKPVSMNASSQAAYQALRDYLTALLQPSLPDQALANVPAALLANLEAYLVGKTSYQDETGQRWVYAADLAAWAGDLMYGAGLAVALPLATVNPADFRAATLKLAP